MAAANPSGWGRIERGDGELCVVLPACVRHSRSGRTTLSLFVLQKIHNSLGSYNATKKAKRQKKENNTIQTDKKKKLIKTNESTFCEEDRTNILACFVQIFDRFYYPRRQYYLKEIMFEKYFATLSLYIYTYIILRTVYSTCVSVHIITVFTTKNLIAFFWQFIFMQVWYTETATKCNYKVYKYNI